jgi:capsid protein
MTHLERYIGLGYDLPYELLMKDFSRLNYVTARAMLAEAWRSFMRRRDWLTTAWIEPFYRLWLEEAVSAGKVDAPDYYATATAWQRIRVIGPGRGTLDPVKEATAAQARIDAGLSTREDECAELGRDWVEVAEQLATEEARYRELGLTARAPDPAAAGDQEPPMPERDDDARRVKDDDESDDEDGEAVSPDDNSVGGR